MTSSRPPQPAASSSTRWYPLRARWRHGQSVAGTVALSTFLIQSLDNFDLPPGWPPEWEEGWISALLPYLLFAAMGLSLGWLAWLGFRALCERKGVFFPRLSVQSTPKIVRPGEPLFVRWEIDEGRHPIRSLSVRLEARKFRGSSEVNRERHAMSSNRDSELLQSLTLLETDDPESIRRGHLKFELPKGARSSYQSAHTWISWRLVYLGKTDHPPGLEKEFDVKVRRRSLKGGRER